MSKPPLKLDVQCFALCVNLAINFCPSSVKTVEFATSALTIGSVRFLFKISINDQAKTRWHNVIYSISLVDAGDSRVAMYVGQVFSNIV